MARRNKIGIIFRNYSHWTGGVNYIINLVLSMKVLPDEEMPLLVIYTTSRENFSLVKQTGYPYLLYKNMNLYADSRYVHLFNRLTNRLTGKKWLQRYFSPYYVRFVFPQPAEDVFKKFRNYVSWIPDFQEIYYPEFFSTEEINSRHEEHLNISKYSQVIVFSSQDALKDFNKYYPGSIAKKKVLNFAVNNSNFEFVSKEELEMKYGFSGKYYISPNQFWVHKNHKVVIAAITLLKDEGKDVKILFTGKEEDYRRPNYAKELKKEVFEKKLEQNIRFLGFIEKEDLLSLIKYSVAVVQPSLFEGWSTIIEDAKSLNKFVIASEIEVHKEQLKKNVAFFKTSDARKLADYLKSYFETPPVVQNFDYSENIKGFASSFIDILTEFPKK